MKVCVHKIRQALIRMGYEPGSQKIIKDSSMIMAALNNPGCSDFRDKVVLENFGIPFNEVWHEVKSYIERDEMEEHDCFMEVELIEQK